MNSCLLARCFWAAGILLLVGQIAIGAEGQTTARPFRDRSVPRPAARAKQKTAAKTVAEGPKPAAIPVSTSELPPEEPADRSAINQNLRPGQWALETLWLKNGKAFHGLIQAKRDTEYDFAEIVQPPGKPMHAVVRGIPIESVARIERLGEAEHQQLVQRFATFRNRAVIEAGRIDEVELTIEKRDGKTFRVYRGEWFELFSTTDDEPTRQSVVRLEQIFRAFRTVLPPRTEPRGALQIYLYGSLDEYQERLRQLELPIDNAAFYAPGQRMIVAGSELTGFARRLQEFRTAAAERQREFTRLEREFTKGLAMLSADLKARGFSTDEINAELSQRKANWKAETKAALDSILLAQRANEAKFAEVTNRMFARLYHEAFHAYLDHFVYPHGEHHVPRWLNEGLAQIFESGQLEGEMLRIDAPPRSRLLRLKADLQAEARLPLAEILTSADQPFLTPHEGQPAPADERMYLYAWGLAWHLSFQRDLLGSERFSQYLSSENARLDPIPRFEQLAGKPLDEFERQWRESVETETPPPR